MKTIRTYASDIERSWKKVGPYARPYLDAMHRLDGLDSCVMHDDARDIVTRFLCNAAAWRGEDAKRIKQELRNLLEGR